MSGVWKQLPDDAPANGAVVWCRLRYWSPVFLAEWKEGEQVFEADGGLVVPWYEVERWKAQ